MKFDYTLGKEATFQDWVDEGCKRAENILEDIDENETIIPENKTENFK